LLPIEDPAEAQAWLSICRVRQPPPADVHTQHILDALATQKEILRHSHTGFLIDQLKGLLEQGREHQRVCMVVTKLMTENGKDVGDVRTSWAASAGDVVDIALTLQRFTDTRECGLKIFEMLMAADAYKPSDALSLLDRRFPT
jgi:hypothetical protein